MLLNKGYWNGMGPGIGNRRYRKWAIIEPGIKAADEAITPLGHGFDEAWLLGGITQGLAQPGDGAVQAMIEVNKRVRGPQVLAQFIPRDHFPGPLQQQRQNTQWLFL